MSGSVLLRTAAGGGWILYRSVDLSRVFEGELALLLLHLIEPEIHRALGVTARARSVPICPYADIGLVTRKATRTTSTGDAEQRL